MPINSGLIIWAFFSFITMLLLLASLRTPRPRRGRGAHVPLAEVEEVMARQQASLRTEGHANAAQAAVQAAVATAQAEQGKQVPEVDEEAMDKEMRHWCAQGLRGLGYSAVESRRMAELVPHGMDLQQAIQWALRNKGAAKK